jgi:hypothetical protein
LSTGYALEVPNLTNADVPIFNRVVVTTPSGRKLVLRPATGLSVLTIYKGDNPESTTPVGIGTGTFFLRLRSEYLDGSTARAHPSTFDTSLAFATNDLGQQLDFTETALTNIPNQSIWRMEYYLASQPTVLAATQTYKTRARAMTIGELRTQGMVLLAPDLIREIQEDAQSAVEIFPGQLLSPEVQDPIDLTPDGGGNAWSVPSGVSAPTRVLVFGAHNSGGFNDVVFLGSSARTAVIPCSSQGVGDNHCASQGRFAANVRFSGLQLIATDAAGRGLSSFYGFYKLNDFIER